MLATAASFSVPWKSKQVSLKGDDSCVLHTTEEEGESYVKEKQEVGVTINPSKTHIEFGMVELEKCIVTKTGFKGCLLRKIGSVVFAEPQGKPTLNGVELINFVFETVASLERRGAVSEVCRLLERAMLRTGGMSSEIVDEVQELKSVPIIDCGYGYGVVTSWPIYKDVNKVKTEKGTKIGQSHRGLKGIVLVVFLKQGRKE